MSQEAHKKGCYLKTYGYGKCTCIPDNEKDLRIKELEKYQEFVEKYRNHQPEHPDDERSWIPLLLDSEQKIKDITQERDGLQAEVKALNDWELLYRSLLERFERLESELASEREVSRQHCADAVKLASERDALQSTVAMKKYFVKPFVATQELQAELNAFVEQGWSILKVEICSAEYDQYRHWIVIAEREVDPKQTGGAS